MSLDLARIFQNFNLRFLFVVMDPKNIAGTVRNFMNNQLGGDVMVQSFMEKIDVEIDGGQIMQVSTLESWKLTFLFLGCHLLR